MEEAAEGKAREKESKRRAMEVLKNDMVSCSAEGSDLGPPDPRPDVLSAGGDGDLLWSAMLEPGRGLFAASRWAGRDGQRGQEARRPDRATRRLVWGERTCERRSGAGTEAGVGCGEGSDGRWYRL